ncbi:MAG: tyrosine--tRNA ligase [Opitutales bacterium]|nr:tyrosine--tRNA ligase [Opitutales bacterium]MBP3358140.1 tyrosine--tRNA ligase [Opitutales bacterium]MBQ2722310.1 tyrosine--tRNA ligase [Opitutales bacterium]
MNQLDIFAQNAEVFIGAETLKEKLEAGKQLRVKLGVDPTRPDLTFGHMVVFNKLRQFQDAGHKAVLIIGDFTACIGDPSGRSALRPVLSREEVLENAKSYLNQAFKVLNEEQTEVHYNSEWFGKMSFADLLDLARKMTVARMLERDDFAKRYAEKTPISIVEFLYPLVQGYDSIMVESDVELGGTDQLFNNLVGRDLQRDAGQSGQAVLTMPLLVGLDGEKKMSKSYGNYIAFNDSPRDMFGKIMSISDETMWKYYQYLMLYTPEQIARIKNEHPMKCKKDLACLMVARFYGVDVGKAELANFEKVFSKNEVPDDMPEFKWSDLTANAEDTLINVMSATKLFPSKKEVRRLIEQGAVKMNSEKISDVFASMSTPSEPVVLQAGKRIFFKVIP